ncbi:BTB/POZ domain-containing protein KCTD6-like [Amphiura filiformis]|uniref:BTB/POZ domain-containing protein KCTD6-like n=1 Tax=Amphiura filiformis TaxID=82378 RepID=UPI003B21A65F
MDEIVTLNVGGHVYTSSLSTLTKDRESMLGAMFSGEMSSRKDNQGNYVIDRDGKLFRYVLNFLRSSKLLLPDDFKELDMLGEEAEFYQIKGMVDAVKLLQVERDAIPEKTNIVIYSPDTRSSSYGTHGLWYFLGPPDILSRIPQIASYKATETSAIKEDILLKELGQLGFALNCLMPAQYSNRPYNCWVFVR